MEHRAQTVLERPFVHYVANQPPKAREHFYGIREAKPDLIGIAVYDRLDRQPPAEPQFRQIMWRRRELENYLCSREALLAFAEAKGREQQGEMFGGSWGEIMQETIQEIESALAALGKPIPWGPDIKASDDFLDPLFQKFYHKLGLPNLMRKTDYHTLAPFVPAAALDDEIHEKLDLIAQTADQAKPRRD